MTRFFPIDRPLRVLFLNPEQYVDFENEPSNFQLRLPILHCGLAITHHDHVYQRDLRAAGRAEMDRRVLDAAAVFEPDLVIYSATWEHENVSPWVLRALRDGGRPVVSMLWDSWIEPTTGEAELLAASTVLVVGDSLHTYLRCRLTGEAMTPPVKVAFAGGQVFTDLVRPLPDEPKEFDVTLLGSNEGERTALVARLAEELPRYGIRFNKAGGLVDSRKGALKLTDNWVDWPEYVRIINRSRLCLNSATDPTRLQIKGKIFDYLACRVACLTDANAESVTFLPPGTVAMFDEIDGCVGQIRRLLADERALAELAETGHRWLRETFDYKRFWSAVLMAAVGGAPLPTLPLLEEHFIRSRVWNGNLLRQRLNTAAQAVGCGFDGAATDRLPVRWLGRRGAFHRLELETGEVVATNRMPVDLVRRDGGLLLLGLTFGTVRLPMDAWVDGRSGATARCAGDRDGLDAAIDAWEAAKSIETTAAALPRPAAAGQPCPGRETVPDVVVLAGGLGTRIRSVLGDTPKLLAPVGERVLLDILLGQLADQGARRVVLALGYGARSVLDHLDRHPPATLTVVPVVEPAPLGTAGAIRHLLPVLPSGPAVVMNGDTLTDLALERLMARHRQAAISAMMSPATLACVSVADTGRFGRLTVSPDGFVTRFAEKGIAGPGLISAGLYVLGGPFLERIAATAGFSLESDYFQTAVPGSLAAITIPGRFVDIGTPEGLTEGVRLFGNGS